MKTFALCLLLIAGGAVFSQKHLIRVEKSLGKIHFFQDGKSLNYKELKEELRVNPGAFRMYKSGRFGLSAGKGFAFVGGIMVGWPLADAVMKRDPNWTIFGIGAGALAISLVLYESGAKKAEEGVGQYNEGLPYAGVHSHTELRLVSNGNGLGLSLGF
jgi:hypothetical protein